MPANVPARILGVPLRSSVVLPVYAVLAFLGRMSAPHEGSLSLVWPAAGVALVWLLTLPTLRQRVAAAIATGALVALTGAPFGIAAGPLVLAGVAHAALGLATAGLLEALRSRRIDDRWLGSTRDAVDLVVAAVAGAAVTAPLGAAAASWSSRWQFELLWAWVARNAAGTVIVGSVLLLLLDRLANGPDDVGRTRTAVRLELLAHFVASVAFGWVVFGSTEGAALSFGCLAGATWAGYRFSPLVAAGASLVYATGAALATLAGFGPFSELPGEFQQTAVVQLFAAAGTMLALLLSLSVREHRAVARRLAHSEAEAREQAELFRAVAATVNESILVVGADGRVVMSNPAADRLVGRGRPLRHIEEITLGFQELDRSSVDPEGSLFARALKGETVHGHPYLHVHPVTGRESVQSVSAAPLAGGPGAPDSVVLLSQDVTTQQAQLAELQSFAGIVAHDLKSPLTSIVAWGELLQMEDEPARQQDGLERMLAAAFRMNRLIDDLLDYSRTTARKLGTEELDLDDLVGGLVAELDSELDRPVTVEHDELGTVVADPTLTKQTLTNLLRNAAKYVAPGVDPHIRVTSRPRGDMLAVTVADNGIGIPAEARHRVFETFYRAAHSYPGTGLGLAICKRAVERHGGEILVEDHPTSGTAITFTLPAAMTAAA
ncbi:sensor histidine kinase [Nocardioides caldifontis]|uniref:sensor histidine kinase n=1 Tax=Nocardioides caldifontis TaxID=2588938 RepID=UPI0011DF8A20|nr:PAS domain-containing sensor histidine kinase [Nocardioides caldifontis]